jgi:hypothetical protein
MHSVHSVLNLQPLLPWNSCFKVLTTLHSYKVETDCNAFKGWYTSSANYLSDFMEQIPSSDDTNQSPKFCTFLELEGSLTAHHGMLSRPRWVQSKTSHPIPLRYTLILSSHLWLGLPRELFPSYYLISTVCTTCYTHLTVIWMFTEQ